MSYPSPDLQECAESSCITSNSAMHQDAADQLPNRSGMVHAIDHADDLDAIEGQPVV